MISKAGRPILNDPIAVWWVQIKNKAGRVGWTTESDKFTGNVRF